MANRIAEVNESLRIARLYVLEGGEQILTGHLDEAHSITICPGATALATFTLLLLGSNNKDSYQKGLKWLGTNRTRQGWGKVPTGKADKEVTSLVQKVLLASKNVGLAKLFLPSQGRELSQIVLKLGQHSVPGMKGPEPEEISLPNILSEKVLVKLPPYGRPVVVAAALMAVKDLNHPGVWEAVDYLSDMQMEDGSWCEDVVATSLATIALVRAKVTGHKVDRAGRWLKSKQYESGAWPAFDQLFNWSIGLALSTLTGLTLELREREWLKRASIWLAKNQYADGSFGSTPPFTQPDLDDTALGLMGIKHFDIATANRSAELLRKLQNEDGSWSTFPSYKGNPPSVECVFPIYIPSPDVTIHALGALWGMSGRNGNKEVFGGISWLLQQQLPSGEVPGTWYEGPIYATAQTLEFLYKGANVWRTWPIRDQIYAVQKKALEYLLPLQNADGSWGSSVVETSLVLSALLISEAKLHPERLAKAISYLQSCQLVNGSFQPSYQAIYAKGWNYEEPLTTSLITIKAMEKYKLLFNRLNFALGRA